MREVPSSHFRCEGLVACDNNGGEAPLITVVVPAFNEAARLALRAQRFQAAVEDGILNPHATELIVVDDGSTDETGVAATKLLGPTFPRLRVLRQSENAGKGAAIRRGIGDATAPVVLFMDADMSVDPVEIPRLAEAMETADVAIGSRELADSVVDVDSFRRRIMGRTFNVLVSTLTDLPYRDTQCGFKAFRTPMARLLFHWMRVQRFAFDVEILCLARRLHMDIAEVPVQWREMRRSSVRMIADPISMARDVLGVRRQRAWPPVPALAVTESDGEAVRDGSEAVAQLARGLGWQHPMMLTPEGGLLVLLPLAEPVDVWAVAKTIQSLTTRFDVKECAVSIDEIAEVAPFRWIDYGDDGAVEFVRGDPLDPATQVAVAGWRSSWSSSGESKEARARMTPVPHGVNAQPEADLRSQGDVSRGDQPAGLG